MPQLSQAALKSWIDDQLMPEYDRECTRLRRIDKWSRWEHEDFQLPKRATREHQALRKMSKSPWLSQVVTATVQCMYVDGYRSAIDLDKLEKDPGTEFEMSDGPYGIWLANGWDSRQIAVHRAMITYGYCYATCLPGEDYKGDPMPVIRGVSPRKMVALYENPAEDDWPEMAMQFVYTRGSKKRVKVYDETYIYTITLDNSAQPGTEPLTLEKVEEHGAGVVPVVRYCKELDLDGRTRGDVEPYIALAERINKTSYDRLLVQHWNSWKIRWIAGMNEPDGDELAVQRAKMKLSQEDLLIAAAPDTKFGVLAETSMSGFIEAHQSDIETLAAVSQTPTHELTGQMINLSAEALAAARASQMQKVYEIQKGAGRAHVQLLRLACSMATGLEKYVHDITGRVTWQDTSIQSMAAAVDALGKAAQMLGVPLEALWAKIPGVEKPDVEEWIKMVEAQGDPLKDLQAELERQATSNPATNGSANSVSARQAKPARQQRYPAGQ